MGRLTRSPTVPVKTAKKRIAEQNERRRIARGILGRTSESQKRVRANGQRETHENKFRANANNKRLESERQAQLKHACVRVQLRRGERSDAFGTGPFVVAHTASGHKHILRIR